MVELDTRPDPTDRTARTAALWATAVAVPIAVLVGVLIFLRVTPADPPSPAPTTAAAVPAGPVAMDAPKLPARAAQVCLAVTSRLPGTLRTLPARKVTAGEEQNAAYGEPPITVACGVAQPAMCASLDATAGGCVPLDSELLTMNRVCWYAARTAAANVFTTMDREVAVRVTVPVSYPQSAQWANEFSDTVVATDKSRIEGVPSGCP
jgi:hypothetical protein